MKRTLLVTTILLLSLVANAYDAEIDGIYYNFSGNNATVTYKNTNYNSYSGSVVIPETVTYNGQNYSVTSIGEYAFSSCSNLISITIGSGILTIGNKAFNSTSLRKIIWLTNTPPTGYQNVIQNVNQTRNYVANNQYSSLSNVTIYPFLSSLFEVDGVKYVPVSPSERTCDAIDCAYNESAENINIGEAVTYRGISLSVKQVKPYLCFGNKYIKNVNLSSQCDVGSLAFYECTSLTEAIICNRGDIGNHAFSGCSNLSNATIHNVGSIEDNAFFSCSVLQTADLGESVKSIGSNAFRNCVKLKNIIIPDSVTTIGSSAFSGCSSMTFAKIGNGVKTIPTHAFSGCSSLQDVQIGSSVTSISTYAFYNCSSLPSIQIPKNVTTISDYVFSSCTGLKTILMDDGEANLNLGSNGSNPLFASCPLDSVYIGRNITYPTASNKGYSPFYRNTNLRSVTITDKETEISTNEFYGCTNLKNVRIGNGVTTFGDWAFSGCSSLDYFSFGSSVETIGKEAFSDCTAMTSLISKAITPPTCGSQALDDINKWNCTLIVPQNCMAAYQQASQWKDFFFIEESNSSATILATGISLNQTTLSFNAANQTATLTATITPSNATNKNVTWTSSNISVATVSDAGVVTSKANGTAIITAKTTDGTNLTATCNVTVTITIDNDSIIIFADANVKAICVANWDTDGDGELSKAEAAAVTNLGIAFKGNTTISSFNELKYFTGLTSIGSFAFGGCSNLTSFNLPNNVKTIGNCAFQNCSRLTSINIPEEVTTIEAWAFYECSSLTSVAIAEGLIKIGYLTFGNCSNLSSITIPNSVNSIESSAFQGCSSLTSITIPDGVTTIHYATFWNCSSLTSINIPNSVTSIGNSAFSGCTSLTSVTIPNSVNLIGQAVFSGCSSLNSITIPNSVASIEYATFRGCSCLTSVTIPNSVTSIGYAAFRDCSSLTSITIPESVTSIGEYAFCECTSLTSITIPNSVTFIDDDAFSGCSGLTSASIGSGVINIGSYVFAYCDGLKDVYCHAENVPETYSDAFNYSPISSATLHVSAASLENYKANSPWNKFGSIVPLTDEDAIIEVKVDEIEMEAICYDAQGRMIAKPQKGINIIRYSDGTSKKVLIK